MKKAVEMFQKFAALFATVVFLMTLFASPALASESAEPGPFSVTEMTAQTGAGIVAGGLTIGAGSLLMAGGQRWESPALIGTGLALALAGPLVTVPLAVNSAGSWMGYDSRHLGGYLGALVLGIPAVYASTNLMDAYEMIVLPALLYTVSVTVGSVVGYHLQTWRSPGPSTETAESGLAAQSGISLMNFQMRF